MRFQPIFSVVRSQTGSTDIKLSAHWSAIQKSVASAALLASKKAAVPEHWYPQQHGRTMHWYCCIPQYSSNLAARRFRLGRCKGIKASDASFMIAHADVHMAPNHNAELGQGYLEGHSPNVDSFPFVWRLANTLEQIHRVGGGPFRQIIGKNRVVCGRVRGR